MADIVGARCSRAVSPLVQKIVDAANAPNDDGRRYIDETRQGAPFRRVRRSPHNSAGRYAGEKMGYVQEAESLSVEFLLLLELDFAPIDIELWPQPKPLPLDYRSRAGRRVVTSSTPDCLVLLPDRRAILIECKEANSAEKRSSENDPRLARDSSGNFIDPASQSAAEKMGIPHLVLVSTDFSAVRTANYLFIGKGFRKKWRPGPGFEKLARHLSSVGINTYEQLVADAGGWTADDIVGGIAQGLIYMDLDRDRLGGLAPVRLYASAEHAELANANANDGRAHGPNEVLHGECTRAEPDFSKFSPRQIRAAWEKLEAARKAAAKTGEEALSRRERGLVSALRKAASSSDPVFLAFVPRFNERGNRTPRLDDEINATLNAYVEKAAASLEPVSSFYGSLLTDKTCAGKALPSRQTFYVRVRERKADLENIAKREGPEAKYQSTPSAPLTAVANARAASRAWQLAILDHTPLPIRCLSAFSRSPLSGSPWLTYMRDRHAQEILGMYLTWRHPSAQSVLGCIWDCFRTHKRVPEQLFLDGEKAHDSIAVETLLGESNTDKICRRYMSPRDGADIERGFLTIEHGLLCYLQGNYVLRQDPKSWPRGWNPAQFADRTLGSLWLAIRAFLFDYYNTSYRPATFGGLTPTEVRQSSCRQHGERQHRIINDLERAKVIMLPFASRSAERAFERQTGIRMFGGHHRYFPSEPVSPDLYGKKLVVRYDPLDITYVMVFAKNRWLRFEHQHKPKYAGLSPDQLSAVSVELIEHGQRYQESRDDQLREHARHREAIEAISKNPLDDFLRSLDHDPQSANPAQADDVWGRVDPASVAASSTSESGR